MVVKRLIEVIQVFDSVYGKNKDFSKIRPVLASQVAYPEIISRQLDFIAKKYSEPKNLIYAIAGAPYISLPSSAKKLPVASKEDIYQMLKISLGQVKMKIFKSIDNWDGKSLPINYQTLAKYYELKFIAYEGGPDTSGEWELETKIELHRDKLMRELLLDYLNSWFACGGDLFMYYNLLGSQTKHGSWGIYEKLNEPSVKSEAVLQVANSKWEELKKLPCN